MYGAFAKNGEAGDVRLIIAPGTLIASTLILGASLRPAPTKTKSPAKEKSIGLVEDLDRAGNFPNMVRNERSVRPVTLTEYRRCP